MGFVVLVLKTVKAEGLAVQCVRSVGSQIVVSAQQGGTALYWAASAC